MVGGSEFTHQLISVLNPLWTNPRLSGAWAAGVPRLLLWALVAPACPSTAPVTRCLPDLTVSPRGQSPTSGPTAGIQAFPEKMPGGGREEGTLGLSGEGLTPPVPSPGQHQPPPHPTPLQLWKLVPQLRKMNLLEASCLAARANQAVGAPHLPPGTRAAGAGPEGLEGGRALPEAYAPRETDRKKQEAESRPLRWWGHRPAGSGAAATPHFLAARGHTGARLSTPTEPLGIFSLFSPTWLPSLSPGLLGNRF